MRRPLLNRLTRRRLLRAGLLALFGIFLRGAGAAAAGSAPIRPLGIDDSVSALSFHIQGRPDLSPDSKWVAYTVCDPRRMKSDPEDKLGLFATKGAAYRSMGCDVWTSPTEGGTARNLTQGKGNNWGPSWSPDGRLLAFYSDRNGLPQLWSWEARTGRIRLLSSARTRAGFGFEVVAWTPDSRRVIAKLHPEGMTDEQLEASSGAASEQEEHKEPGSTVVVYRSTPPSKETKEGGAASLAVSNWTSADLSVIEVATGRVRRLAPRIRAQGFWISPEGETLAYLHQKGRKDPTSIQILHDLVLLDLATGSSRTAATGIEQMFGTAASWSPDGRRLAYFSGEFRKGECFVVSADGGSPKKLGGAKEVFEADYLRPLWDASGESLYLVGDNRVWRGDVSAFRLTAITPDLGPKVFEILQTTEGDRIWSPDGKSLYISRRDEGSKKGIFSKVDLSTGGISTVLEEDKSYGRVFDTPLVAPDGRSVVYLAQSARESEDLWIAGVDFRKPRRLTAINPQLDRYTFGASRLIDFTGLDGQALKAALLLPSGYEEGNRYPTVVLVYPQDVGSESVHRFGLFGISALNMQMFATRGYAVLQPDAPVGKGTIMQDLIKSVMPAIDAGVRLGVVDPDRLAVTGQSGGGYATLAIVAQTNRFKAAIMNAGFGDLTAFYGSMDLASGSGSWIPWLESLTGGMGTAPWDAPQSYIQNSPIYYLHRIQTPILIQAGSVDSAIVPYSDQVFAGLKRAGKEALYLRYGGEGHVLAARANLVDYWKRVTRFLDERLRRQPADEPNQAAKRGQK